MKKTKESRPSVAEAEKNLATLEAKRAELIARGEKLPELRRAASYAAHVEGNAEALRALNRAAAEALAHESSLASIDDAIADAKNRILIAQAFEADVAARAKVREAAGILTEFKKAGHDLDTALRAVGERASVLTGLLGKLHQATGARTPSYDQLDALGYAALQTAIQRTPWAKRFRPVAPSERREFGPLFEGWSRMVENRLRAVLAEPDDEAA